MHYLLWERRFHWHTRIVFVSISLLVSVQHRKNYWKDKFWISLPLFSSEVCWGKVLLNFLSKGGGRFSSSSSSLSSSAYLVVVVKSRSSSRSSARGTLAVEEKDPILKQKKQYLAWLSKQNRDFKLLIYIYCCTISRLNKE